MEVKMVTRADYKEMHDKAEQLMTEIKGFAKNFAPGPVSEILIAEIKDFAVHFDPGMRSKTWTEKGLGKIEELFNRLKRECIGKTPAKGPLSKIEELLKGYKTRCRNFSI